LREHSGIRHLHASPLQPDQRPAGGRDPGDGQLPRHATRAALAARKAQGVKLGNPVNLAVAGAKGAETQRADADAFAANVLPIVRQIQTAGVTTHRAIAAALNDRGVRTARGGDWHDSTVRNLIARAG